MNGEKMTNVLNTSFVTVEEVKKTLCVTPAWGDLWPNVDCLLRSYMFKELIMTSTASDGINYKYKEEKWTDIVPKLDLAIIGLLWCSGS